MNFKPDKKTKQLLQRLSEFIENVGNKLFYTVMGGVSVDGHVGKLTRNHPDVDFLIFKEDLEKAEIILEKLGYKHKRFTHPEDPDFVYKMQTGNKNHIFSFQIIDKVEKNKFEISFYRDLRMRFPISLIEPQIWLTLEGVKFPSVSKKFLIRLKENEISFYKQLKTQNPNKYEARRKVDHLKSLHDIELLKIS